MVLSTMHTRATRSRTLCFMTLSPLKSEPHALPRTRSVLRLFAVSSTRTYSCEDSPKKAPHLFFTFPRQFLSATLSTSAAGAGTGSPTLHRRGGFMVQRLWGSIFHSPPRTRCRYFRDRVQRIQECSTTTCASIEATSCIFQLSADQVLSVQHNRGSPISGQLV